MKDFNSDDGIITSCLCCCCCCNDHRYRRKRRTTVKLQRQPASSKHLLLLGALLILSSRSRSTTIRHAVSAFQPSGSHPKTRSVSFLCSSKSAIDYYSLTVKDLRQLVKESPNTERGILSRLKRKQDLIDYLTQQEDGGGATTAVATAMPPPNKAKPAAPKQRQMAPIKMVMPPPAQPSPKDVIFEQVYQRYPPVRDQSEQDAIAAAMEEYENNDGNDDDMSIPQSSLQDVRQHYHPIFHSVSKKQKMERITTTADRFKASHNILSSSDMDLVFVGTASCTPGVTRGVSCTALRLNWQPRSRQQQQHQLPSANNNSSSNNNNNKSQQQKQTATATVTTPVMGTWLFDVGECTQLQIQRTASIKPSKITKIFLTHAHGDHSFGLPGLLCLMGQDRDSNTPNQPVVEIYGPEGLRMWLRVAIRYSVSRIVPPYVVHELMEVPMAPEWAFNQRSRRFYYKGRQQQQGNDNHMNNNNNNNYYNGWGTKGLAGEDPTSWISQANTMKLDPSPLYGEMEGGKSIYPSYDHPLASDGAPVWDLIQDEDVRVYAAPMSHGIPCVGYSVHEAPRPGRLRDEYVKPIVERNIAALKQAGFQIPMKAMAVIKNLKPGSAFTFPDGTVVTQEEAVEPPRQGRKIVICGDTADSRAMYNLARDADVVVHEATNAYLQGVDSKDSNLRDVTRDAIVHGHSTPQIAGDFCRAVRAKRLILNHFSARYKGDTSVDSLSIMMRIEKQAMNASGLSETEVAAAWDLMVLPIPQH